MEHGIACLKKLLSLVSFAIFFPLFLIFVNCMYCKLCTKTRRAKKLLSLGGVCGCCKITSKRRNLSSLKATKKKKLCKKKHIRVNQDCIFMCRFLSFLLLCVFFDYQNCNFRLSPSFRFYSIEPHAMQF